MTNDLKRPQHKLDKLEKVYSITLRVPKDALNLYHDVQYKFKKRYQHQQFFGEILRANMIEFLKQLKEELDNIENGSKN